jgi:glycosyltransferase involved in cell wall biosynthesis
MMVSVVIPTHNRVELLKNAVESVLKQTYEDYEMIIVDDGSTDGTGEFLKGLRNDRMSFHRFQEPVGGNLARNKGITMASGEFVAFLDDDDEWMPEKLEKQMKLFEDNSVGLVYTGSEIIYTYYDIKYKNIPRNRGDLFKKVLIRNCIGTTSSVVVRKSILEIAGLFDEDIRMRQDQDLWIRICRLCNVDVVEEPLIRYFFRKDANQISLDLEKYWETVERFDEKYSEYIEELTEDEKLTRNTGMYKALASRNMRNGNNREARKYLWEALKLKFSLKIVRKYVMTFFGHKQMVRMRKFFDN